MSEALNELASYLREARGALIADAEVKYGELTVTAKAENLIALLTFLRDDVQCGFVSFIDVCGSIIRSARTASMSSIIFSRRARTSASA